MVHGNHVIVFPVGYPDALDVTIMDTVKGCSTRLKIPFERRNSVMTTESDIAIILENFHGKHQMFGVDAYNLHRLPT